MIMKIKNPSSYYTPEEANEDGQINMDMDGQIYWDEKSRIIFFPVNVFVQRVR